MHMFLYLAVVFSIVVTDCSSNLLAPRKYCGYQHADDYDRESQRISLDEFPWVAQLLYDKNKDILCTGSLINNRYVLTAAHCIKNNRKTLVAVRLGDFNVTTEKDCVKHLGLEEECSDPVQEITVEEIIPHPWFSARSSLNDIGLVRLSQKVVFSDYVRPICLPVSTNLTFKDDQEFAVSGWGLLEYGHNRTTVKKKVPIKFVTNEKCNELYKNLTRPISQFHICAIESDSITCQGDSGGPLMLSTKSQWEQVGVLSFGKGCGTYFPTVYVNTASYLNWIKQNLKE